MPSNNNEEIENLEEPHKLNRWNWGGAFLLGGFWAIGNKTYIGLLCYIDKTKVLSFSAIFIFGIF